MIFGRGYQKNESSSDENPASCVRCGRPADAEVSLS